MTTETSITGNPWQPNGMAVPVISIEGDPCQVGLIRIQ